VKGPFILGRTRNNQSYKHIGSLEKRQAILAALTKATAESPTPGVPAPEPEEEVGGYYTLTLEELAALVNGDMEKIGSWVSNLDRRHATWLLRWLIKERQ
jgi:hypothetical protein